MKMSYGFIFIPIAVLFYINVNVNKEREAAFWRLLRWQFQFMVPPGHILRWCTVVFCDSPA